MSDAVYKRLKKQNGERFARVLRNYHNGLLEIPNFPEIVKHAGRDAEPLLPYLMSLMPANDDTPEVASAPADPLELLDRAGYDAFYADDLEKQNSIKKYYAPGELLCTFNDKARYKKYHIVQAVRKDVDTIKRSDFVGKEERDDAYGTSVISIQIAKEGGFISIKNRYNHTVEACDHTFGSNPDNIIPGLTGALKDHFNVDFSANSSLLPNGFVLMGDQIFRHHTERDNIYFGDQAWAKDGQIHTADRGAGDAVFDEYYFDNRTKSLSRININSHDRFVDDFNAAYGGNKGLHVDKDGKLLLHDELLIGAENSRIKTLYLPELTKLGPFALEQCDALEHFEAPKLKTMDAFSLRHARGLKTFRAPVLESMDDLCLENTASLTDTHVPSLKLMGNDCFYNAKVLKSFEAPSLESMNGRCFNNAYKLEYFQADRLNIMDFQCLQNATSLRSFIAPELETMQGRCLYKVGRSLIHFDAPKLREVGDEVLHHARPSIQFQRHMPDWTSSTLLALGM